MSGESSSKLPVALLRRDRVDYHVELAAEVAGVAEQSARGNEARVRLGRASPSWISQFRDGDPRHPGPIILSASIFRARLTERARRDSEAD
jgi:hypothetical protein